MSELLEALLDRAGTGRGERLIRLPEVKTRSGKGTTTIYRDMANGTFPKPVPIGGGRVAWIESQIDAWIQARIDAAQAVNEQEAPPKEAAKPEEVDPPRARRARRSSKTDDQTA